MKALILILVVVAVGIPSVSKASMFDWVPSFKTLSGAGQMINANVLYAGSNPVIDTDDTDAPTVIQENAIVQRSQPVLRKNKPIDIKTVKKMTFVATAYSSTPDQTDDSPFITAKGTHVRDGIIATNDLPFNTLVKMPELYGDKIFVVEDRMNSRYTGKSRLDVWFADRASAIQFGAKTVQLEIVGSI